MNVIEIKKLTKSYFKTPQAVHELSLSVPEGSIFGILGPNGAGKSTLLNILAGLLRKTSGEISIFGNTVDYGDFEHKQQIGFVLEEPHYLEKLSVREYLHFTASMYTIEKKEAVKRADELIEFFGLKEKEDVWIQKYSKGMKKKVSLAAAMIHRPELLILDEPLEGVDPVSAKEIKDNLRMMTNKGVSILVTSHNLDTVEKFCDEIAIINKGKLVFQCKTEEIHTKIKNELTQETYESLEEIFIDVVTDKGADKANKKLSWL